MKFIALFIFYINIGLYGSNQSILSKIQDNCIWVKYKSIADSSKVDSLVTFINNNKINKVFIETYTNGMFLYEINTNLKTPLI